MTCDHIVRVFAGVVILLSLGLGVEKSPFYYSNYILWVTVFVGANLLQSGITRFCPLEFILKKTGMCKR
ncbi:MAG: DUF2892 domain-containing protein [Candidatus Berkiella sp.]